MPPPERIRLACEYCDRADKDGVTPEQLEQCKAEGWIDVSVEQSYEDSIRTYDDADDAPPDFDVFAWYTHLGVCPTCAENLRD